ncbi:hypothetical protein ACFWZ6_13605 [Streptomyces massasporeus]
MTLRQRITRRRRIASAHMLRSACYGIGTEAIGRLHLARTPH